MELTFENDLGLGHDPREKIRYVFGQVLSAENDEVREVDGGEFFRLILPPACG